MGATETPNTLNALVVAFTVALSGFLNFSGDLDSMAFWKVASLTVCSLILGAPVAGMAAVWTAAKVQEMKQ